MHLKSLEISGFKSFARRTTLEFKTPITAIVGPNGSGKSNVSEALRFVLGEQSVKSMRGKRAEDLIWNGAEAAPRGNRAAVKLVFDNTPRAGKRLFNLDFDEVAVERSVFRDAGSEYAINGTSARLRDIHELLLNANLSHAGYHIISQGEADRVLSASARERRAFIEDALGLRIYQWKRSESEKKLEKTREHMREVGSLRRELAPHLSFLKKQAAEIERAKKLKDELVVLYRDYFAREAAYIKKEKEALERGSVAEKELDQVQREYALALGAAERKEKTDEVGALSRELGRLEGESAGIERALRERKAGAARVHVSFAEVETLAAEVEQETIVEKIKGLVRAFVEKYRRAPTAGVEMLEKQLGVIGEKRRLVQEKIQRAEELARRAHEGEVLRFRLLSRKAELEAQVRAEGSRRAELEHREADFKREQGEAAALVGRSAVEYPLAEGAASGDGQEERWREIERRKIRLEEAGGGGPLEVQREFSDALARDEFLAKELADLETSSASLTALIAELGETLDREFNTGLARINAEFAKLFTLMFGGGTARVREEKLPPRRRTDTGMDGGVADEHEAFHSSLAAAEEAEAAGVGVEVSIPRKKIKGLAMLSGGERALVSIALIFALSSVKPPPFIVLDETDAALDEANSKKYGDMIESLAKHSQLILITHNRETMSRAGVLYGVTMQGGASRLLSLAFDDALAVAK